MNEEQLAALVAIFREEAEESLDALRRTMEVLADGADAEQTDECFRLAHNLKGASAAVGLDEFSGLAHLLEDLFTLLQARSSGPSGGQAESAFEALAELERMAAGASPTRSLVDWRERLALPAEAQAPTVELAPPQHPSSPSAARSEEAELEGADVRTIRVDPARLDELLRLSTELVALQGRLRARSARLGEMAEAVTDRLRGLDVEARSAWAGTARTLDELGAADRLEEVRLASLTSAFEGAMRSLRMTRLDGVAGLWRRTVADAAARLGKEARLAVEVGDIEIDKHVLDRLRVPVVHLLRNAVAHGVEAPEVRFERSKPRRGQIVVTASLRGPSVSLSIEDDGGGLDVAAVRATAVRRGLVDRDAAEHLPFADAAALIFEPGFSTAATSDRVSGRGYGLDEVRAALEELGGTVSVTPVASATGGTRFELVFPCSVLSTRGLLVRETGEIYAVPLTAVERTMRTDPGEGATLDGAPVAWLPSGEALRLVTLSALVGSQRGPDASSEGVVVVRVAEGRLAIAVEEVLWDAELVIRPLPWNLREVPHVSGLAPLPDGELAIVVDPRRFAARSAARARSRPEDDAAARGPHRVLVAEDSLTRRTLHCNLMRAAGYEVESAVDGEEAWQKLHASTFDLLVSDVQMPRLDGLELTRRIRAEPALSALKIVLVTGLTSPDDERRGYAAGADGYVAKGDFDQDRLLATVTKALEAWR